MNDSRRFPHPLTLDVGHLRGCFPCCRLKWLIEATPDQAERELHRGGISADEFEGYMHVWATSAVRISSVGTGWEAAPSDAAVVHVVEAMRSAIAGQNHSPSLEVHPCH